MFNPIAKSVQRVSLPVRRVLIVDPREAAAQALGELLRDICAPQVWVAPSNAKALKLAGKVDPDLVICEMSAERVDGPAFTRTLRRSDLACRKAPVILVSASPNPAAILAARDAGAHEFLRRPFTMKDVMRRLEAALLHPRSWVEAVDYVGPDRRRFNLSEFPGELKRLADHDAPPHAVRVGEALKILRSAVEAMERDPAQALRSLGYADGSDLLTGVFELGDTSVLLFDLAALRGISSWSKAAREQLPSS